MEYRNLTIFEIAKLVRWLGGINNARAVLRGGGASPVKYGSWTVGQVEALINKIGEEKARLLLSGEQTVKFEEAVQKLFDRSGRRIPPKNLAGAVCDPSGEFNLAQPFDIDYAERLARLEKHFPVKMDFPTAKDFEERSQYLIKRLYGETRIANILNGVHLPVCFPHFRIEDNYYTGFIHDVLMKAVSSSYREQYPDREFCNLEQGEMAEAISIVRGSRHKMLFDGMAQGSVVGIYFPNPLQGFSHNAVQEQLADLPYSFVLSGIDVLVALTAYPDILPRNWHNTGLVLAALSWFSSASPLAFKANDTGLHFGPAGGPMDSVTSESKSYSAGLLFIG